MGTCFSGRMERVGVEEEEEEEEEGEEEEKEESFGSVEQTMPLGDDFGVLLVGVLLGIVTELGAVIFLSFPKPQLSFALVVAIQFSYLGFLRVLAFTCIFK